MPEEFITAAELLARLSAGDEAAAATLFNRFARRLIALARSQFNTAIRRKLDAEDVVQSVFRSFFLRQLEGQFEVRDWDNLWSLLATITVHKCTNVRVAFGCQARNLNREVVRDGNPALSGQSWEALAREPTPAEAAVLTDLVEHLLQGLPERERRIVSLSLEGKDYRQISKEIDRAERTVRRVLEHFRSRLEQAVLESSLRNP